MKRNFFSKKSIIVIGILAFFVILASGIFGGIYIKNSIIDNLNFGVIAENISDNEVDTFSSFLITSEKNYSEKTLKNVLSLNPKMDFSLDKVQNNKYILTPKEELKDNSIYNISISRDGSNIDKSWAFQTKTNFKVASTWPRDKSIYVDLNTGIEIVFSKPVNDISKFFEIYPKVDGSFEYRDKSVIFKPTSLDFNTPYKITIKKGVMEVNGDILDEDFSFIFRTKPESDSNFYLNNGFSSTFISSDIPVITMSLSDKYISDQFNVDVYSLNSVQEYLNFLEIHDREIDDEIGESTDYIFNMSKNPISFSFSSTLVENATASWLHDLRFPEKLSPGWYIADVKSIENELHFQKAIQVSDISVYTYGLNGELDVWCNDASMGNLISGATIQIGDFASLSNKDGIATFNFNDSEKKKMIITTRDGKEFGEYLTLMYEEEKNLSDDYYMYIYTDRGKYFPTDTINFWGAIIPRKSGVDLPEKITVLLGDNEVEVSVNDNGIFLGETSISNYESTWFSIYLKHNELKEYLTGIEIVDYIKPVYKISSNFSKEYYRKDDKIELNILGKFYDGTSAENIKVDVEYGNNQVKSAFLDKNGSASVSIKPSIDSNDGEIQYLYADVNVSGIDEGAESYSYTQYFPTDYYLKSEWDSSTGKLKFSTNKVNYDVADKNNFSHDELYTGESFDQNVLVNIKEIRRIKVKTGEQYNYYTNTMDSTYEYESVEEIVDSFDVIIRPGEKAEKYILLEEKENTTYKAECVFILPDGYSGYREIYLDMPSSYDDNHYYFTRNDGYKRLKTGESTELKLNKRSNSDKFRMIYFVSTDRVNKLGVTQHDTVNITMDKELVPDCVVTGAFFDGKHVYKISSRKIYYDTSEKELDIDITTDKEVYKPGDKIKAKITVKDRFGKPVKTEFVVSAVNETSLVNYENFNPLDTLYRGRACMPYTYASHETVYYGGEGGGGGEDLRDRFIDVLLFKSLTTNDSGIANVEFNTSDDLTSWRITAVAVSKNVSGGIGVKNVSTSVPFFINQVINDRYNENDDVSFSLRVFGNAINGANKSVEYEAKIDGGESKKLVLKTPETAMFNFGKLKPGIYKVTVLAKCGEYNDGIVKEIVVLPSLSEINLTKLLNVSEISNLEAIKYPVKLMFFDKSNALFYRALMNIIKQSNGMTSEQIFAKNFAYKKLNEFYGDDIYSVEDEFLFPSTMGGISNLKYAPDNPLITANICKISPEKVDRNEKIRYFNSIINDIDALPDSVTAAYMGLAALKEPVLNEIKYLLDNDNGLELIDKINLISALSYIGDYDLARYYYEKEIEVIMTKENEYKYIGPDYESLVYKANSRLLTVLGIINHEDFESLLNYVLDNTSDSYISVLDLIVAFNNYQPLTNVKSKMEYELNGKKEKVDFSDKKLEILTLNEKDMESFKLVKASKDILVVAEYVGRPKEIETISDKVTIKKNVSSGKLGEYSNVTLDITLKNDDNNSYLVTDFIPVSSRYSSNEYDYNSGWHYLGYEKQKIKFYIDGKKTKNIKITYKIRNVLTGEYQAESAIITSEDGIISGISNDLIFTVK